MGLDWRGSKPAALSLLHTNKKTLEETNDQISRFGFCLGPRNIGAGDAGPVASSAGWHDYVKHVVRVGYELMVSAWPGPPFAMRAGVRDGMEAFAFGGSERQSAPDGHGLAVPGSRASRRLNMK